MNDILPTMTAISAMNRALMGIPKRAEKSDSPHLHETFVDSGIGDMLDNVDHQVLYGRRGTGKTHAFAYLSSERRRAGDISVMLDLRTVGSPDGIVDPESGTPAERASRLLIDLLGQLRDAIYDAVLGDEDLVEDGAFVEKVDGLLAAITNIHIEGEVEHSEEIETKESRSFGASLKAKLSLTTPLSADANCGSDSEDRKTIERTRRGRERTRLNFSDIARALRELAATLTSKRVWMFLDEWSSVPRDLQPFLGEFLLRCVLPVQRFTVKIAAIEQQSTFMADQGGRRIGLELGADIGAEFSLDDFMVYEGNEESASNFFRTLLFRHLNSIDSESERIENLISDSDVVRLGFTDTRAFDELVRAAEGVPRDFLHILGRAARVSMSSRISMGAVREAANYWYISDKVKALESREQAGKLLDWIIGKVIREKRARAFLVSEGDARDSLLLALFDARVLHIVRRGYSAQDRSGERFDVWSIDYGAYVDLIHTKYAPEGMLPIEREDGAKVYSDMDVPTQDLRAIRRAILNVEEFKSLSN